MIRKETGIFPVSFCYPYNSFNEQVEKIVEKRHVVARTFQQGIGARDTTAENINQWVDKHPALPDSSVGLNPFQMPIDRYLLKGLKPTEEEALPPILLTVS